MNNILSVNDQIEFYLEQIDSACGDIMSSLDRGDDIQVIECCVKNISRANDQLYREVVMEFLRELG